MGIYSGNRTSLYGDSMYDTIDESYANSYGALEMMVEAEINDQSIFEAVVTSDFVDVKVALEEGVLYEAEEKKQNFIKTIWNKICELCTKIKEKVAGVIEAFKKKINEWKMKSLKKHIATAKKQMDNVRLTKKKVKIAYNSHMFSDAMDNDIKKYADEAIEDLKKNIADIYKIEDKETVNQKVEENKLNKYAKKNGTSPSAAVKAMISDVLDFSIPDVMEQNMSKAMVEDAIKYAESDTIKNLNEIKKKTDAALNTIHKDAKKKVSDVKKYKDDSKDLELAKANAVLHLVNQQQQFTSVFLQEEIKIATSMLKIASKIIKIAADKTFAESSYVSLSSTLLDAIGESAVCEMELVFESCDLEDDSYSYYY